MADVNTEDDTENIYLSDRVIFAELRAAAEWLRKIWQIEAAKRDHDGWKNENSLNISDVFAAVLAIVTNSIKAG